VLATAVTTKSLFFCFHDIYHIAIIRELFDAVKSRIDA
jgi:hypothetical protein